MQGGIRCQWQLPYILTHFPGCEKSHQGAGRREEQVAAAAEAGGVRQGGGLTYSPWAELFVLGLSAVCLEEVAEWNTSHALNPPASQVSPGGETGNVTSLPPHWLAGV